MKSKPRQSMLEVIDQLFGMIAVISTIQAGIDVMFLAEPTIDMLAVTAAEHSVYNVLAVNVVQLLQRSVRLYFQRKQLGADSSGGMLAGPQLGKRTPPPAAQDWGDAQCIKRTRFTVAQIWCLLRGFDMTRQDGSAKTYRIYTSAKLYRKRQRNGSYSAPVGKYFLISAKTALLVLLINLARLIAFCDMQQSLNGMPSPEISLTINFMLEYLEPWWQLVDASID